MTTVIHNICDYLPKNLRGKSFLHSIKNGEKVAKNIPIDNHSSPFVIYIPHNIVGISESFLKGMFDGIIKNNSYTHSNFLKLCSITLEDGGMKDLFLEAFNYYAVKSKLKGTISVSVVNAFEKTQHSNSSSDNLKYLIKECSEVAKLAERMLEFGDTKENHSNIYDLSVKIGSMNNIIDRCKHDGTVKNHIIEESYRKESIAKKI